MARRSRLEIYFDILGVIDSGVAKPTQIMYKTNLTWTFLHEMFETLIGGGFVREEKEQGYERYYITEKGKNAFSYHLKSMDGLVGVEAAVSG